MTLSGCIVIGEQDSTVKFLISKIASEGFKIFTVNYNELASIGIVCTSADDLRKLNIVFSPTDVTIDGVNIALVVMSTNFSYSMGSASDVNFLRECARRFESTAVFVDHMDLAAMLQRSSVSPFECNKLLRKKMACKALTECGKADIAYLNYLKISDNKVLVIGSGGREHAIATALSLSENVSSVLVAPGNGGTDLDCGKITNTGIDVGNLAALTEFVLSKGIGLVAVGPEQPLVDGIVDAMTALGVACFGPSSVAAMIEASKAWSKDFMDRNGIRTAAYKNFTSFSEAESYLRSITHRVVVKASGLAAGKGVIIPSTTEEAVEAARSIMLDGAFGTDAGSEIVVEEFLEGEEVSLLAFCDGRNTVGMPAAQDHKRVGDGDTGLNTGGMGAYAPAPVLTPGLRAECMAIIQHTVDAMAAEGRPYKGVLYAGFMLTPAPGGALQPVVLEYNCRFGDPETQVLLPLLKSDLFEVMMACVEGRLDECPVEWHSGSACTIVCAAPGYPSSYPKGTPIQGLREAAQVDGVTVYHAGTKLAVSPVGGEEMVTSGGRVLAVTGRGETLRAAVDKAYSGVREISFDGMHCRSDIARRGLDAPLRLGVIGSTRGTSLQATIDAIEAGALNAKIVSVVSNKANSGLIARAKRHNLPHKHIGASGKDRETYDSLVTAEFVSAGVELILMVGYMRIVSAAFTSQWADRCLNVHPSLLPDFAGGMDTDVHAAVIAAGRTQSGCTIHFVTAEVDSGPIVIQETCPVYLESDTPDTLKARVQTLEGAAFVRAIDMFRAGQIGPVVAVRGGEVEVGGAAGGRGGEVLTYRSAGVDIDAGEELVERIKPFCKATRRPGCDADLGGFGGLFDLSQAGYDSSETVLVSGTDGVGTKLKIAQAVGKHDTIGIDLVAMCVNDILVCGAEPLFFLDYYATGALNVEEAAQVVKGIAEGCAQSGSALIGGETAEMAGMYATGEYDLAGFSVGAVRRSDILPRGIGAGDVLLGLRSSGVHSNGYSLVRKCVQKAGLAWGDAAPFQPELSLGEALLCPTRIYVRTLLPLIKAGLIKGMAHITGGGLLDNLPRILSAELGATVDAEAAGWTLPPVFKWLQSIANLPQSELLRTFNCGIGMVVVVAAADADTVLTRLQELEGPAFPPLRLGSITSRIDTTGPQVLMRGDVL